MSPRARFFAKWAVLSLVAASLGTALGAAYALTVKEPVEESNPLYTDVMPPSAPVPLEPEHDAVVTTSTPVFTWTPSLDDNPGFIYILEIAYDKDFATPGRTYSNIREPRFETPEDEPFAPGIQVYWRVYALDVGLNQGPYSSIFSFVPLGLDVVR